MLMLTVFAPVILTKIPYHMTCNFGPNQKKITKKFLLKKVNNKIIISKFIFINWIWKLVILWKMLTSQIFNQPWWKSSYK